MTAAARDRALFLAALAVGAGTWFGVALGSGQREAWDAPVFTTVGLPVAYAACLGLGFIGSRQAWRWPVLVFGALAASAVLGSRGGLTLWPLTLLLIGLMVAVGLIPTYIGVGLRRLVGVRRARRAAAEARLKAFAAAPGAPTAPGPAEAGEPRETPPAPRA